MTTSEHDDRLEAALRERDHALLELSRERERSNALRARLENLGEPEPPHYPLHAGMGEPPLRYLLVDQLNDRLKGVLSPVQLTLKRLLRRRGT